MNNKIWTVSVFIIVIVIISAIFVLGGRMKPSVSSSPVSIAISSPTSGTTWSFSSKQKIMWTSANLPSGNYNAVIYLTDVNSGAKGYVASEPVENGEGFANYVVNLTGDKNGNLTSLQNGTYDLSIALYRTPDANDYVYGYGDPKDLVAEKDGGTITIVDSDVNSPTTSTGTPMVGNDRDAHGCIPSAGYSWCQSKNKCLRPWEESCTATSSPQN